jgi:AraC-like DNA-binding protein
VPARELSAAINSVTGQNVSQFVNNRRIAEACRLLEETKQSATTIMLDVGFSTKSNFNREFRRVTGKSPRQWRAASADRPVQGNNGLDLMSSKQQLGNVQQ